MPGVTGRVFNVQRFSLHDGPGIRTTVFLKGCPLRCPWCHNPEGMAFGPEVAVHQGRCLACGACAEACPLPGGPLAAGARLGEGGCQACGRCVAACPTAARELVGREWTVDEVVEEVLKDRLFFDESGGGVTFSGGEPLAQPEFLVGCLERCQAVGLHTALDTSAFAPRDLLLQAARHSDLVLFDLKLMDPAAHQQLVGVPLEPILENLQALAAHHGHIWLRVPVVPGMTDAPANLAEVARLAASLASVRRVSLLPYHALGSGKLGRLGRAGGATIEPPAGERLGELAGLFTAAGVAVGIGG